VRANSEALDALHKTIAETLDEELRNYRTGVYDRRETSVDEDGEVTEKVVKTPVPAALIASAIKFLNDNDVRRPDEDEPDSSDLLADELPNFKERP
jgi:hypothetical protein